jgi:hypothetical protein
MQLRGLKVPSVRLNHILVWNFQIIVLRQRHARQRIFSLESIHRINDGLLHIVRVGQIQLGFTTRLRGQIKPAQTLINFFDGFTVAPVFICLKFLFGLRRQVLNRLDV